MLFGSNIINKGHSFLKRGAGFLGKMLGPIAKVIGTIATPLSFIPGPWQPFAEAAAVGAGVAGGIANRATQWSQRTNPTPYADRLRQRYIPTQMQFQGSENAYWNQYRPMPSS